MKKLTTNPSRKDSTVKYRKKLNNEQLAVLSFLYRLRFASSYQIALFSDKDNNKQVQKRLKILEDQGLIAKRYDKSYKLRGKSAAYYLLPKGAREMITSEKSSDEKISIARRIYKEGTVSEEFVQHCMNVVSVILILRNRYRGHIELYSKSTISDAATETFPSPLPDAYIRYDTPDGRCDFFLDVIEETQPFFVLVRRINKYLEYAGSGDWDDDEIPAILIVAGNKSLHKRLRKRLIRELQETYEEVFFATSWLELVSDSSHEDKVWYTVNEDDDPKELGSPRSLESLCQ